MTKQLMDYKKGEKLEIYAAVKEVAMDKTINGKNYISLTVQDKSGELNGKIWDAPIDGDRHYSVGSVVQISGEIKEYQGALQIGYNKAIPITDDREESDPSLYLKTAPIDKDSMASIIKDTIDKIEVEEINLVVRNILNRYSKNLFTHPAAKSVHHAFHGGLAYHTVSMLNLANSILSWYEGLNTSLLYGAILIHDLCKIEEMTGIKEGTEYTKKGLLIGHISMIESEVIRAAHECKIDPDSEMILLLRHMVLSHHGKKEWGSPVEPQIREAVALHLIDQLDASMNTAKEGLNGVEEGEFSKKLWAMNNIKMYKTPNIAK